jgi:hypothetical protein
MKRISLLLTEIRLCCKHPEFRKYSLEKYFPTFTRWAKLFRIDSNGIAFVRYSTYGDSWRVYRIGRKLQPLYGCSCSHDCCGHSFTCYLDSYLFGLISIRHDARNV